MWLSLSLWHHQVPLGRPGGPGGGRGQGSARPFVVLGNRHAPLLRDLVLGTVHGTPDLVPLTGRARCGIRTGRISGAGGGGRAAEIAKGRTETNQRKWKEKKHDRSRVASVPGSVWKGLCEIVVTNRFARRTNRGGDSGSVAAVVVPRPFNCFVWLGSLAFLLLSFIKYRRYAAIPSHSRSSSPRQFPFSSSITRFICFCPCVSRACLLCLPVPRVIAFLAASPCLCVSACV